MYHVNAATGKAGKCTASVRSCPHGGAQAHYTSPEAAQAAFESSMAGETLTALKKPTGKRALAWPDFHDVQGQARLEEEVYIHPQGKIVAIRPSGAMVVTKAGKKATTSSTAQELQAGRGSWKLVKKAHEPLVSEQEYLKSFSNPAPASVAPDATASAATAGAHGPQILPHFRRNTKNRPVAPKPQAPQRKSTAKPLSDRQVKLIEAGYPTHSPFNPERTPNLEATPHKAASNAYYDRYAAASILPIDERGNPHKLSSMTAGEKLRFWNGLNGDGTEKAGGVIEVWSDGQGKYKAVATHNQGRALGSEQPFRHDQTGARMGNKWTLVGAFDPIEEGGIVGEVPDRSMPIYTYK